MGCNIFKSPLIYILDKKTGSAKPVFFLTLLLAFFTFLPAKTFAASYTLTTAGAAAAQTAGNWNTGGIGGGGAAAGNFTTGGDIFIIANGTPGTFAAGSTTTFAAGVTLQVDGTFTIGAGGATAATTVNANGTIVFTSTATIITINAPTVNTNTFALGAAGILKTANATGVSGAGCSLPATAVRAVVTLSTAANYEFNRAGAQTMTGTPATVNNLTFSGSGAKTLLATLTLVSGTLTMSGTATTTTTVGLTITTSLVIGDGTTFTSAGFALTVTGTTSLGGGTSGNLTISSNVGAKLFTGLVTIAAGATWNNSGNSAIEFRNGITTTPTFTAGSGIQSFTTTVAQTLTGTFSIPSLTVTNPAVLTNTNTLTVATALAGTGNLTNSATGILNLTGTSAITTLTANVAGNLINYNGAAQTCKVTTYDNLTISGSLAKTFATTPTVNNVLSMEGTATIVSTIGVVTYGANATLKYNTATGRTATTEEWLATFAATGGVIISNTGTINPGANKVFNVNIPLTIDPGATLNAATRTFSFGGDFINNGTWTASTGAITIALTRAVQSIGAFVTTALVSMTKTGGTATFQGNVGGAGLTINGAGGTLNLGTALTHTFTGAVALTNGILNGGSSTLNENMVSVNAWSGTGTNFTAGTSTVDFGAAGNQTLSATSTAFYNLEFSGTGTKTLSTNNTISANLTVRAGVTLAKGTTTLGSPTSVTLETVGGGIGSIITGTTGDFTLGGDITVNYTGAGAITTGASITAIVALGATRNIDVVDDPNSTTTELTISGVISGATFGITKLGVGTLVLSGSNTYSGITTIDVGTIKLGATGGITNTPLGTADAGTSVTGGATLDLAGFTLANTVTFEDLTLNGTGISLSGALMNSGVAATYKGLITLGSASSIEGGTGTIALSNVGTISGATFLLTLGGTQGGSITSIIGNTSGGVTKEDAGTWTLSGANTYTGATTVNGGTLKAGVLTQAFGLASAVTMANIALAKLDITGFNNTIGSLTGGGALGGNGTLGAATLTIGSDGTSPGTYAGIIDGTGAIIKSGIGALTLSGANIFSGGTTLSAGQLNINNLTAIGSGALSITGGTTIDNTSGGAIGPLSNNNAQSWNGSFTFTGSNDLDMGTGAITMGADVTITSSTNGKTFTAGGTNNNSTRSLTKAGAGNLTFGNTTVTLNNVTVSAGTLTSTSGTMNIAGDFANSGTFTHNSGMVDFNGTGAQSIPAVNFNNLTISGDKGGLAVTLINGGTIGVAAVFSITATNATYTITGNTVDFNGTAAQGIPAFNFNNLTISGNKGAGAVTLINGGTIGVAGTFTASASNTSYVVTNNIFEYNGSGAQTITSNVSPFTTYGKLAIANSGDKTIITTPVTCKSFKSSGTAKLKIPGVIPMLLIVP